MEKGWRGPLLIVLGVVAAPAIAQVAPAPPLRIANPAPAPEPLGDDTLAFGEAEERMTVPVTIGARGPWPFIVDTGSERTVVSRELAGVLGLAAGADVRITAMTGVTTAGTVIVPDVSVSTLSHRTIAAPALERRNMGALGMLGLDALQGHKVAIDFDHDRMTLRPSRNRLHAPEPAAPGEIVIVAKSVYGQLIATDAHWHGVRIAVIIDTGSPISVGNHALFAAITRRPVPLGPLSVLSATGQTMTADAFTVDQLSVGTSEIANLRVAFSDAPPFRRFGLTAKPALMLGMDVLRLFRRVEIDFANREIRFALPRGAARPPVL